MGRDLAIVERVRAIKFDRAVKLNGWTYCGGPPAVSVFDTTFLDIGGNPGDSVIAIDWRNGDSFRVHDDLLPAPALLPNSQAVRNARFINGLEV